MNWQVCATLVCCRTSYSPGNPADNSAALECCCRSGLCPRFQWALFAVGLFEGSFEEIGWTGSATPRLLPANASVGLGCRSASHGVLAPSGRFPINIATMGAAGLLGVLYRLFRDLDPCRLLMTWVYSNTQSLFLAILMHASFTGWLLVLFPATSLAQSLFGQSAFALTLWGMVAIVPRGNALRRDAVMRRHPGEALALTPVLVSRPPARARQGRR